MFRYFEVILLQMNDACPGYSRPGPLLTFPEMKKIKFLLLALTVFSLGIGAQTKKTEPVKINPEICKTCKNYNKPADCEKARTLTNTCPQVKKQTAVKSKKITRKKAKSAPKKKK